MDVLIVDDEKAIAEIVAQMVKSFGCTTQIETSYDEAVLAINAKPFDVGVFDLMLGVRTGYDLVRICREMHPLMHFVAISGVITSHEALECRRSGFDCLLRKPASVEDVYNVFKCLKECKNCWSKVSVY